jgi:hypothetical protein
MTARNSTALSNGSNSILIKLGPSAKALSVQVERYDSQKGFADDPSQDDREGDDEESTDDAPHKPRFADAHSSDPATYAI